MQLIRHQNEEPHLSACVATIGNFDGLHIGHKALLHEVLTIANQRMLPSVLVTFDPSPKEFFQKQSAPARLMNFTDKWFGLSEVDLDVVVNVKFNAALAQMSPEEFVKSFLIDQLGVQVLVVGDDFHFGKDRTGDIHTLRELSKQYDFEVVQVPGVDCENERVSSTRVRQALADGNLLLAKALLGRHYNMTGRVIYGDQRGREWGFPTANVPLFRDSTPVQGIFAVRVYGADIWPAYGVANVGFRPMYNVEKPLLEVYLLDFDSDIYGERLTVEFLHKIRDEETFESVDDLIAQIKQDVVAARHYFQEQGLV